VAAVRRRLNLRDEHPVVGRGGVGEHIHAGRLADSALEHEQLPERVRIRVLGELCKRQEVESFGGEDLLQPGVVLGGSRIEAVRAVGVVRVPVVGARDQRNSLSL
jgi:hypothetical protein